MSLTLHPYQASDRAACLRVFDSNVPAFFLASERADYTQDLGEFESGAWGGAAVYLVLEVGSEIVGCGGAYVEEDGRAGLAWGMVDRRQHRRGLGSLLLRARLEWLRAQPEAREVWLDTSRHSAPFFERFGFQVARTAPDGYGPGHDRLDLRLDLARR